MSRGSLAKPHPRPYPPVQIPTSLAAHLVVRISVEAGDQFCTPPTRS